MELGHDRRAVGSHVGKWEAEPGKAGHLLAAAVGEIAAGELPGAFEQMAHDRHRAPADPNHPPPNRMHAQAAQGTTQYRSFVRTRSRPAPGEAPRPAVQFPDRCSPRQADQCTSTAARRFPAPYMHPDRGARSHRRRSPRQPGSLESRSDRAVSRIAAPPPRGSAAPPLVIRIVRWRMAAGRTSAMRSVSRSSKPGPLFDSTPALRERDRTLGQKISKTRTSRSPLVTKVDGRIDPIAGEPGAGSQPNG